MKSRLYGGWLGRLLLLGMVPIIAIALGGCPAGAPTTGGGDENTGGQLQNQLTEAEEEAINNSLEMITSLTGASTAVQGALDDDSEEQAGFDLPITTNRNFGSCPQVAIYSPDVTALGSFGEGELRLTLDYGTGCEPFILGNVTMAGSATGTISAAENSLTLTYDDLTMNDNTLTGQTSLSYEIDRSSQTSENETLDIDDKTLEIEDETLNNETFEVEFATFTLTGSWDLTYTSGEDGTQIHTEGNGTVEIGASMDRFVTTIVTFIGTGTSEDIDFTVTMEDIKVSYTYYSNFIPYNGTLTITGEDLREITVMFTEDTPSTCRVYISIDGGPPVPWELSGACYLL